MSRRVKGLSPIAQRRLLKSVEFNQDFSNKKATLFYITKGDTAKTPELEDDYRRIIFNQDDVGVINIRSITRVKTGGLDNGIIDYQEISNQMSLENSGRKVLEKLELSHQRMIKLWSDITFHDRRIYIIKIEEDLSDEGDELTSRYYAVTRPTRNESQKDGEFRSWSVEINALNVFTEDNGIVIFEEDFIRPGGIDAFPGTPITPELREEFKGVTRIEIDFNRNFILSGIEIKGTTQRGIATQFSTIATKPDKERFEAWKELDLIQAVPKIESNNIVWVSNWPFEYKNAKKKLDLLAFEVKKNSLEELNKLLSFIGKISDKNYVKIDGSRGIFDEIYGKREGTGISPFELNVLNLTRTNNIVQRNIMLVNGVAYDVREFSVPPRSERTEMTRKEDFILNDKNRELFIPAYIGTDQFILFVGRVSTNLFLGLNYNQYFKSLEFYEDFIDPTKLFSYSKSTKVEFEDGVLANVDTPSLRSKTTGNNKYLALIPTGQSVFESLNQFSGIYVDPLGDPNWQQPDIERSIFDEIYNSKNVFAQSGVEVEQFRTEWFTIEKKRTLSITLPENIQNNGAVGQVNDGFEISNFKIKSYMLGDYSIRYYDRNGIVLFTENLVRSATRNDGRITNTAINYVAI